MKRKRKLATASCLLCGGEKKGRHFMAALCNPCSKRARQLTQRAGHMVRAAIELGLLPPLESCKCVDCGDPAKFYDHRDYGRPLEVDPVCHGCNVRRGPAKHPIAV